MIRVNANSDTRQWKVKKAMKRIIPMDKSVIVAVDVPDLGKVRMLAEAAKDVSGIGGFKFGFRLALRGILAEAIRIVKGECGPHMVTIYDNQKAGTDIPDLGKAFAEDLVYVGVDAGILFPMSGPVTQRAWTEALFAAGVHILTGTAMTHASYLRSEGGYLCDEFPEEAFGLACELGCRHFVVPGTKVNLVDKFTKFFIQKLGDGNFVLYAPGFISQLGAITDCGQVAGNLWNAIIGSAFYKLDSVESMRRRMITCTQQIAA